MNERSETERSETSSIQESQSDISLDHSKSTEEVSHKAQEEEEEEEEVDYVHTLEWKHKKKHVFILSDAGKPIYSR